MAAPHTSADTPVMRQFLEIKSRYPDAILMFRMGDFYEMFFEDAVTAAPVLDIALTSRDKGVEDPVPMAGVPYHALGGYLRTLVERGMKVAICEQMETPDEARRRKGPNIVRREVVRVVTPGALLDEEHLRSGEPNFLAAVVAEGATPGACSLALLDISSGEFIVIDADSATTARAELARFEPREVLADPALHPWLNEAMGPEPPRLEALDGGPPKAQVQRVRAMAAEAGVSVGPRAAEAGATVLAYAEATQPGQTLLLHRIRRHEPAAHLVLDESTVRNLELFRTLRDGTRKGSLLWSIDQTRTSMGARTLRAWLGAPSRDLEVIRARADGIEALLEEPTLREQLQSRLKDVRDVVRLAARARLGTITPRELGALRTSLAALPALAERVGELAQRRTDGEVPSTLRLGDDLLRDVHDDLARTLVDEPPAHGRDGGMIREGADEALDEQRRLRDGGREALAAIETRERERTGIPSLKVQHNRVFGYFLEVPKAHLARVPDDYVRKQTLASAERYVTEELAGHEAKVLGAQAQALLREQELFAALRSRVSEQGERLAQVGERMAVIDVLAGLAEVAARHDFCRPVLVEPPLLEIAEGRHPVVERMLGAGQFVPNDTRLRAHGGAGGEEDARLQLITGPNMGGKSTIMRQVALIAILAHVGSFVPARSATVGLVDRVFTRVGAADDLGRGDSTFMVEMRETAHILSHASDRSLVLLDEIGRGTATFDGLALAWAITEFLHDQVGCRTMFATHYHELCALENTLAGVRNVHVTVHEQRGRIVFLHQVERGAAGRSYGIQVGRLAGLPARVLRRADRILERLEADPHAAGAPQLDLFTPRADPEGEPTGAASAGGSRGEEALRVLETLEDLDPDELSPREAHELLRRLVEQLGRA
ncbi:MAG: DNA mismatch repair protein MutS [Myxococcales bacterium]|nr:DNA mismatch repair protein MutS [Myxococcales bacterium]MCB9712848.1 DNA mismatch repair protein MutS [Myxococcales bacterium]